VVGLSGVETYGDLKKKATGGALAITTGIEDKNT
jgi:hypothetical protein